MDHDHSFVTEEDIDFLSRKIGVSGFNPKEIKFPQHYDYDFKMAVIAAFFIFKWVNGDEGSPLQTIDLDSTTDQIDFCYNLTPSVITCGEIAAERLQYFSDQYNQLHERYVNKDTHLLPFSKATDAQSLDLDLLKGYEEQRNGCADILRILGNIRSELGLPDIQNDWGDVALGSDTETKTHRPPTTRPHIKSHYEKFPGVEISSNTLEEAGVTIDFKEPPIQYRR